MVPCLQWPEFAVSVNRYSPGLARFPTCPLPLHPEVLRIHKTLQEEWVCFASSDENYIGLLFALKSRVLHVTHQWFLRTTKELWLAWAETLQRPPCLRKAVPRSLGFIKHLKWIMTQLMEQVLERNYTLKCRDENKDKRTRRRVVIRPCQLWPLFVVFASGMCTNCSDSCTILGFHR